MTKIRAVLVCWALVVFGPAAVAAPSGQEVSSETLPAEVVINGVEFIHVPAGAFWHVVGTGDRNYTPPGKTWFREVNIWIDGYYVAKYEARARDFKRFLESQPRHLAEYGVGAVEGCSVRQHGPEGQWRLMQPEIDLPATHMSWNLASEFAQWMGFRLLRETEWVKAARGTDRRTFPWGEDYPDDTFAGFGSASGCNSTPVDAFPNGRSPYGVFNMAGNVLELVADWENHDHDKAMKDGDRNPPPAATGTLEPGYLGPVKISKGGRWGSNPNFLHVYGRRLLVPETYFICYGTRFALDESAVLDHLRRGTGRVVTP